MGLHFSAAEGPPGLLWPAVLRALREARGVSQEGWAAWLGVSRKTVQRWEQGSVVPDALVEQRLIEYCREKALFQTFDHGSLSGLTLTAALLGDLLAEGRLTAARKGRPPQAARRPTEGPSPWAGRAAGRPAPPPGNLPLPLTDLIGRQREIEQLKRLLGEARLVNLTGVGGAGKTRLALEVARRVQASFPDGVWLAELAALSDPALVPRAVAAACGVSEVAGRVLTDLLVERLHEVRALLVLDNCEHVSGAAAALVTALLRACRSLRILTTSRQPLGVPGEHVWRVPPLSLPDPRAPLDVALAHSEAAQLFLARAYEAGTGETVAPRGVAAVAAICRRLDGIPLALELAASRTRALTVEQIAERLEGSFRLLSGGSLQRHQTIQAAIDWSHDLLTEEEQTLFRRLAVFAGGFTLEAAEAVCALREQGTVPTPRTVPCSLFPVPSSSLFPIPSHDVLNTLVALVDKSLVTMGPGCDGAGWYRLLEPLRQYAAEKLAKSGEVAALGELHRDWYLALVEERANPGLKGEGQAAWLTRLDQEKDNLRAALRWTAQHGPAEAGLRLISAVTDYWQMHGDLAEGLEWAETALAVPESRQADPRRLVNALNHGAILGIRHGAYARARALLEEALEVARSIEDPLLTGRTLNHLGIVARDEGDLAGAQAAWDTCLSIFEDLNERYGLAVVHTNLCLIARDRGQYDLAQAHGEAVLALDRERADERGISIALHHLGLIALERDDLARARALHEDALARRRGLGFAYGLVGSLSVLGTLAALQDDFGRAEPLFAESLSLARDQGYRPGLAQTLRAYGQAALDQGDARAAAFLEESLSLARELGDRIATIEALAGLSHVNRRDGDLDEAETKAAESLALARETGYRKGTVRAALALAEVMAARGDPLRAAACYRQALSEARELESTRGIAASFEGLAALVASSAPEQAAGLLGTAAALRERIGVPLPPRQRDDHGRLLTTLRRALGDERFAIAEAEGRATPLQTAIEEALDAAG